MITTISGKIVDLVTDINDIDFDKFIPAIPKLNLPSVPDLPALPQYPKVPDVSKYVEKFEKGITTFSSTLTGTADTFANQIDDVLDGLPKLPSVPDKWLEYANPDTYINLELVSSLIQKIENCVDAVDIAAIQAQISEYFIEQMKGITKCIEVIEPLIQIPGDIEEVIEFIKTLVETVFIGNFVNAIQTYVATIESYTQIFDALRLKIATAEFPIGFDIQMPTLPEINIDSLAFQFEGFDMGDVFNSLTDSLSPAQT